ncbi:BTB/POZ and MATH domain-containing protein 2-like [Triticum dicoccoides]|uniref:BTB/POZ and MATH domain-containing protein 2-like n=1 Tax=Triticum dicoccoides TaxID=85692 RepID=UPI000E7C8327|nr:BTB/POZ and MATH domain-containing protein 2-like [Triticum dicoccoides]
MSSFAGVSVLADGGLCPATESFVDTGTDCGYHLLVVQDYRRTKQEAPTGDSITSRPFTVGGHDWYLHYYPNGENLSCADYVSLSVSRLYDDEGADEVVDTKFGFSFVDQVEKQNPVYIRGTETCSFPLPGSSWSCDKFVRRHALERSANLRGDCFTIRCDIMVVQDTKGGDGEALLPDIHRHFGDLFQTNLGADVTFEVCGEMIAAHRCVLAARSKVFRAQLFGPMKEGSATTTSSVIQIKDMEANIFRALLSFVYTDSFPAMHEDSMEEDETSHLVEHGQGEEALEDKMSEAAEQGQGEEAIEDKMSEVAEQGQGEEAVEDETRVQWLQDLFVAADRYDLQRLKFICEKQLSELIGVSSVASTLALAERHHCRGLEEACIKFIQVQSPSCLQTIMATDGWEHIITTYPSVLNELIAEVIALNQQTLSLFTKI